MRVCNLEKIGRKVFNEGCEKKEGEQNQTKDSEEVDL